MHEADYGSSLMAPLPRTSDFDTSLELASQSLYQYARPFPASHLPDVRQWPAGMAKHMWVSASSPSDLVGPRQQQGPVAGSYQTFLSRSNTIYGIPATACFLPASQIEQPMPSAVNHSATVASGPPMTASSWEYLDWSEEPIPLLPRSVAQYTEQCLLNMKHNRSRLKAAKAAKKAKPWCCSFVIMLPDDVVTEFGLVAQLIGRNGVNTKRIAQQCSGKVRVRGTGSRHLEGPTMQESLARLQIALSCESEDNFEVGFRLVSELLDVSYKRFHVFCRERGWTAPKTIYSVRHNDESQSNLPSQSDILHEPVYRVIRFGV